MVWLVPRTRSQAKGAIHSRSNKWSGSAIGSVLFLCLFLALYIVVLLYWEDFAYYDNYVFTLGTLAGHNIPIVIWPDLGRFVPLCNQEYNVIRHFTDSVAGYHILRIVQLIAISAMLVFFDVEIRIAARVGSIFVLLITPSIVISFGGLIYPESNLVFSLACLVLSVKRFEETRSLVWAVAAVVFAQFALYYKETAFLFLLGFALGRLLLRCWKGDRAGVDLPRLRDPESRLDLILAILVVPFVLYYLAAMFPDYRTRYADEFRLPIGQVLGAYLKIDLLAFVLVIVVLARVFLFLQHKVRASLLFDGLAIGAVACGAGYCALHLHGAYYFAPVDFVAVLYVGRYLALSWRDMRKWTRTCCIALLALIVTQDLSLSCFRMYERKNVIDAKAEMAQVIQTEYTESPEKVKRLYFPFTHSTIVMDFGAYLSYRGVPIERDSANAIATRRVMIVGKAMQGDGPCVYGKPIVCHFAANPAPGDVIVILPDDSARTSEMNAYGAQNTDLLFSYEAHPLIPQWMKPFVGYLHVISPRFFRGSLPDSFLHGSLALWKDVYESGRNL